MTDAIVSTTERAPIDVGVAEFIDMARSANVFFDVINGRLTVRAINPNWKMWSPIRHFLDEIGTTKIMAHLTSGATQLRL